MQAEGTKEKWRYASSKSRSKEPKGNGDMQAAKREREMEIMQAAKRD